jgi:hypothetical protein
MSRVEWYPPKVRFPNILGCRYRALAVYVHVELGTLLSFHNVPRMLFWGLSESVKLLVEE